MNLLSIESIMQKSGVAFGTSGARGLVSNMTDEVCYAYTLGFLQYLLEKDNCTERTVAFGGDLRPSTPRIIAACMAAAKSLGFECDYQGFVPSPALALYGIKKGIPSIMVTGSHIPDNRNGIKFCTKDGEITKADEVGIRAQTVGRATPRGCPAVVCANLPIPSNAALQMYREYILNLFPQNCLQGINIGFYQHSAVGRDIAVEILTALGAKVTPLARSEKFIPVDTEAIREEDIEFAKAVVGATAGAATGSCPYYCLASTDGDSDRPLLSDEKGNWFRGDSLGILAAKALGIETVVIPVSCNTAAEKSGYFKQVSRTKIGSPYVIEGMKQIVGAAGYEANGGFLTQNLMTRDALTPIIATIIESKKQGLKLSELLATLPPRYTASGLVKELEKMPENACKSLNPISVNTIDGYRMEFENGDIVHLRKSGNAPEFRCYTESSTLEKVENLKSTWIKILESWKIMGNIVRATPRGCPNTTPLNATPLQRDFENLGNNILQKKQIAAFLLAGGQGSRLGFDGPKGAFKLEALNKSIFQIHAENLHGKDIPWVIMTSPLNHKETIKHFEQANYFGLNKEKIKFFEQGTVAAITSNGEPIFDSDGNLVLVPDGNGGCFRALSASGTLAWLKEQGIEYVFMYGVDNILAKPCDAAFIGAFVNSKMAAASKVVKKKSPDEKMGVFALQNGLPTVIEYSEIPPERKAEFDAGNIVAHLFTMESLKKLENEPLPWHLAIKRICGIDGAYKFEQFLFDAFPKLGTMFLAEVEREKEFAPIKNASGEDSPKTAVQHYQRLAHL